ncbi:MAG: FadR/GntR family transcriptional regulator [Pikeienuella sp.]
MTRPQGPEAAPSERPDQRPAPERIAGELRAMILDGALGPDQRLPGEQELAARFGVSRPTLREALKRLAAQNLIRTKRGAAGGSFVSRLGWEDAREEIAGAVTRLIGMDPVPAAMVAEARLALLTACAPLAAARRTEDQLARMRAEIALQRAEGTGDREFCASDVRFHRCFAEATGNALLALQTAGVIDAIQPLLNRLTYRSHDRAAIALRHARIVARLARREVPGLIDELAGASAETARLVREAQALRARRDGA